MKLLNMMILAVILSSVGCNGVRRLTGQDEPKNTAAVLPPFSNIQISWSDQQVVDALTFDERKLLDKTFQFFDTRYEVAWKPLFQAFLDGKGRNVMKEDFTDAQFRRVLIACSNLGRLDGLTF